MRWCDPLGSDLRSAADESCCRRRRIRGATFLFVPLGLFYASRKGALAMSLFLVGVPVALSVMGVLLLHLFVILLRFWIIAR
jgi:hypothetical protein